MRTSAPALLPIFRSQAQAEVLAWLYLHPDNTFSLTDLARRVGVSVPTLHRLAEQLVVSQLATQTLIGRNRMLGANGSHPVADPLARLLETMFGPKQVVSEEFADIPGAQQVFIFGSWAARYAGEPGRPPNDIDVLVIGDTVSRDDIYAAADRAQSRLGLPVNPTLRTNQQWLDASDTLAKELKTQPILDVTATPKEPQ
jgi:DNA-binding IscR family transcriptional regulator